MTLAYVAQSALWAGTMVAGAAVLRGVYEEWKRTLPWM